MRKKQRYMGAGLVLIGCFFLFDPYISVVDILPDFIGYALICIGLSRLRDMNDRLGTAYKWMMRLMLLGMARTVSLVWAFSVGQDNVAVSILIVGFALAVLDVIALIPAWNNLTNGWFDLGTRLDGAAITAKAGRQEARVSITERIGRDTVCLLILKEVLAVLPEFAALAAIREDGDVSMNWYTYISLFRTAAIFIAAVIGIAWLVKVIVYASRVRKDICFWNSLREAYEQVRMTSSHVSICRKIRIGTICVALGGIASIDFHVDGMDVLPGVLAGVLFLVGAVILRSCVDKRAWLPVVVGSVVYVPISICMWLVRRNFEVNLTAAAALRSEEARSTFYGMCGVTGAHEVAFLVLLGLVMVMLYQLVARHTGYEAVNPDDVRSMENKRQLDRYLNRRLTVAYVAGVILSVGRVAYTVALPYLENTHIRIKLLTLPDNDVLLYGTDMMLHIVFAVILWAALSTLRDEVQAKYRLY